MKWFRPGILVIMLATLLPASCMRLPDCFKEDVFCAALVTDTLGLKDHGLNQDTWMGLGQSRTEGVLDRIEFIESVDARDYGKNIAYFAQNGFDVIITSGTGMRDETLHAADLFSDSVFIGVNQPHEKRRPNLIPITFAEDQMGFLAGALAAYLTETGVVAAVCETSGIDSMWRYCEGFRTGARYVDEKVKTLVNYRDDGLPEKLFVDESWGNEQARELIGRGADVIFAAGGATGQGALIAAHEAGIHAIGSERDQAAALSDTGTSVVTSVYGLAGFEVQKLMRLLRDGGISEPVGGQFDYVPLEGEFPENLAFELDSLLLSLSSNVVKTNVNDNAP